MTIEEISSELPSGLHDLQLKQIMRNMEFGTVRLDVKVVVGLLENGHKLDYRDAAIIFEGVQYLVSEFPDSTSVFRDRGTVWLTIDRSDAGVIPNNLDKMLPPETQRYSCFVREWYSSFHIAAGNVSFAWI